LFIFFYEKENEPKEIAPAMRLPARLKAVGRCETRCAQTVTAPFSTAFCDARRMTKGKI